MKYRKFVVKRRGVSVAMALGVELRKTLREQLAVLLRHWLLAVIEDRLPSDLIYKDWQSKVMGATLQIHNGLSSWHWMVPTCTLLVNFEGGHGVVSLVGPSMLVEEELLSTLLEEPRLVTGPELFVANFEYEEYVADCWAAPLISDGTLGLTLSILSKELVFGGSSYVTAASFRKHKKMLDRLYAGESQDENGSA